MEGLKNMQNKSTRQYYYKPLSYYEDMLQMKIFFYNNYFDSCNYNFNFKPQKIDSFK